MTSLEEVEELTKRHLIENKSNINSENVDKIFSIFNGVISEEDHLNILQRCII